MITFLAALHRHEVRVDDLSIHLQQLLFMTNWLTYYSLSSPPSFSKAWGVSQRPPIVQNVPGGAHLYLACVADVDMYLLYRR